jgi:hypothetical protein
MDGNSIGCGDLIQARRNDHTIQIGPTGAVGATVANRATYTVLGPADGGGLLVRDATGNEGVLPAGYVAEHVTLGYAATVWAAQGRTVDTTHALIEPTATRRSAYVALTRGRESNTAYVVCERPGDEHTHEPLASTACTQLALVLANTDDEITSSAEKTRRDGITEAHSLAWIASQWDLVATELTQADTTRALRRLLPSATAERVEAESGYQRLCRAVRAAELDGHDPIPLLGEVIGQRLLDDADSITDVLRRRIHTTLPARTPERDTNSGWAAITAPRHGPMGDYLAALATVADHRQSELATHTLEHPPVWALEHLGSPPEPGLDRDEWARRAGIIAAYRELAATPEDATSLGGPPSREQPLHRALWQRASTAAGTPADALDFTCATTSELHQMRAAYHRQLAWAPPYVHDELRDARIAAAGYRTDAILWRAEAEQLIPGTPERARADSDTRAAAYLSDLYTTHAQRLHVITEDRRRWHHDTESDRTRYELAGDELTRRGLPRGPTPTEAQQLALLAPDLCARALPKDQPSAVPAVQPRMITAEQPALFSTNSPALTNIPSYSVPQPGRLQATRHLWNDSLTRIRDWAENRRRSEGLDDAEHAHRNRSYHQSIAVLNHDYDIQRDDALDMGPGD